MKIVIISDTHGRHEDLGLLEGDVLIHCGDLEGRSDGLQAIDAWFGRQRFERIFCVGGNHDDALQEALRRGEQPLSHARVLTDERVDHRGLGFYGAPWVPDLSGWAFYASEPELRAAWARIPGGIDVLITHTPPRGILDVSSQGRVLGCPELARHVARVRPRLHCFGHVHASPGQVTEDGMLFVNATSVNSSYEIAHPPFEITL